MNHRIGRTIRVLTGVTLLVLALDAARSNGFVRGLAGAEIAAAAVFCFPRVWRFGGVALLAVLAIAFGHHAIAGHFAASLLFAAFAVALVLAYERP